MKNSIILIVLLIIISLGTAFSQANFYDNGDSGTDVALGLFSGAGATDISVGVRHTPNGKFDFGLFFVRSAADDDFQLTGAKVFTINPFFRYFMVKEDDIPISLALRVAPFYGIVKSDEIDLLNWDVTSTGAIAGADLYLNIKSSGKVQFQPFGTINYQATKVKVDTKTMGDYSDDDTTIYFTLGSHIILDTSNSRFSIAPEIVIAEGDTRFGVALHYIMP